MAVHPETALPPPTVVLTCPRCTLSWEHVRRRGGQPTYCPECRPLARADHFQRWAAHSRKPQRASAAARTKSRERKRLDRRGLTHAWKGLTEQQWVDRWRECPWLFEALVRALELSVAKFPDWQAELDQRRAA